MIIQRILTYTHPIVSLSLTFVMSACIQNTESPVNDQPDDPLLCEKNDQVNCMPDEDPRSEPNCSASPEEICANEWMLLATEAECEAGEICEEVVGSSDCGESVTVLCKHEWEPVCVPDVITDPDILCAEEGLIAAEEGECDDDTLCQTISAMGPCGESLDILCKEPEDIQCNAAPECGPDQIRSDAPCLRGEESCETVTKCGETITCRPGILCDAVPECEHLYEFSSRFSCAPEETDCYGVTVCEETIFCRTPEDCSPDWEPYCEGEQVLSFDPCLSTENLDECQHISYCGVVFTCRNP